MEFALEVLLGDLKILQGHVGTPVAEEFYHGGKADARAYHLRSVGVAELVRDDAGRNSEGGYNFSEGGTQSANHLVAAARPRQ
jgi:hypothetical protein